MSDLQWSRLADPTQSDDLTPEREEAMLLLPATMPELEEKLGSAPAHAFCQWGGRTKRFKFDRYQQAYVKTEKR